MFLEFCLCRKIFEVGNRISCQECLKLRYECAASGHESNLTASGAHAMEHPGAVDVFDAGAVLHVGLIGLLLDELWGVDLGDHDDEADEEDGDEYFEDVAAHAAFVEDPIFAHEGSEFAHQKSMNRLKLYVLFTW